MMKVLLVCTSDRIGGAAVACYRLMNALCSAGVEARMLVRDKVTDDPRVHTVSSPLRKAAERAMILPFTGFERRRLWGVDTGWMGVDITETEAFRWADVIHLHWINQGFISLDGMRRIIHSGKKVVFTMHDMWYCTSICHHAHDCSNYLTHCHHCPLLLHPYSNDLSYKVFEKKSALYASGGFTVTAVSSWLQELAARSALLKGRKIVTIPNVIDVSRFPVKDKKESRRQLNLPADDVIIAFAAARLDDSIKDFPMFAEAVALARRQTTGRKVHVALIGTVKDAGILRLLGSDYTHFGYVGDCETMSSIYSASDICVSSSRYETFGQTLVEAMSCGCIPVSFGNSGQRDIINDGINGKLIMQRTPEALADGIVWASQRVEATNRDELHSIAKERYSQENIAQAFIEVYKSE